MKRFDTGRASVTPPASQWDTLIDWGRQTGPDPGTYEGWPWNVPGPPPCQRGKSYTPVWAVACLASGATMLALCGFLTALIFG